MLTEVCTHVAETQSHTNESILAMELSTLHLQLELPGHRTAANRDPFQYPVVIRKCFGGLSRSEL